MVDQMVELVVSGIDFDDDVVGKVIADRLNEFAWGSVNEVVTVSVVGDLGDLVDTAAFMADQIHSAFSERPISIRWHDDLVTTTAIADRIGITREAVRLWAKALRGPKDFPEPFALIPWADKVSPVWRWARISAWLDAHGYAGDGVEYPTDVEIAMINAQLVGASLFSR